MDAAKPTILFATDYSAASHAALENAISLARAMQARLLVLHVTPPDVEYVGVAPSMADRGKPEEDFRLAVANVAGGKIPVEYEHRVVIGDPASEILEVARREPAAMIVMGTTGRTGLRRLLMGSVAEAVVRRATCPVVTTSQTAAAPTPGVETSAGVSGPNRLQAEQPAGTIAGREPAAGTAAALDLLTRAVTSRASDIHIDPVGDGFEVRFRIDGRLRHFCRLGNGVGHAIVAQLKVLGDLDIADPFHPKEGRLRLPSALASYEARLTSVPAVAGEAVSLRLLDRDRLMRPLGTLGLSAVSLDLIQQMLKLGQGLIIAAGPSGSGKTTTVYSMLNAIDDAERSIVSVEDPVEYYVPSFRQIGVAPKRDVTMTSGLRMMLRTDPDVVLIGEIRDPEAAEIGMRAASSGKYVFTTFHTRDVASVVTAFRDLGIDNRSLAGNLTGIISQRLVRRVCHECCRSEPPTEADRSLFASQGLTPPDAVCHAVGCARCNGTGYWDRIGVFEVALPTENLVDQIVGNLPERELRAAIRSAGIPSLFADGLSKVRDCITTLDEIRRMTWIDAS